MARRMSQEINAGSMADIAFLLLIFFLVTTTMDSDWGIQRLLPPPDEAQDQQNIIIKERNVFVVLANANDMLLVENEYLDVSQLKEKAKEFIMNPRNLETMPESEEITVNYAKQKLAESGPEEKAKWQSLAEAAEILGPFTQTKQVISLQNDRGTSYSMYIQVQDELAKAYQELRDEMAMKRFGETFAFISDKAQQDKDPVYTARFDAIKTAIPLRVSEAEPKITTR